MIEKSIADGFVMKPERVQLKIHNTNTHKKNENEIMQVMPVVVLVLVV